MPTSVSGDILIQPAAWLQQTWAQNWEFGAVPLWGGELDPHLTQYGRANAYNHAKFKFHLDPSNGLATIHQRYRQSGQTTHP